MADTNVDTLIPKLEAALAKNSSVFARNSKGEFVTTKTGHAS